jgi:hypothetical protein
MPLEEDFIYLACGVLALIAMALAVTHKSKGVTLAKAAYDRPHAAAAVVLTVTAAGVCMLAQYWNTHLAAIPPT